MKYDSEKAFPYLISSLFLFPLFKESILTLLLMLLLVNTIIYVVKNKKNQLPKKQILYLTIPFWIVLVSSLFHFKSLNSLKPVGNAMFFLLFPLVFNYIPLSNFTSIKIEKYLTLLKNVCLFIIFFYFIAFFYNYTIYDFFIVSNNVSKFRNFIYNEITFFKIHPNYFTTVLMFCTAFSLKNVVMKKNWLELLYVFFFILITFLLITKINVVFLTGLIVFFLFFQIKGFIIQKVLFFVLFLGVLSFLVKNTPGLNERIYEFSNSLTKPPKDLSYNSTNIRVALYNCDFELAKENFWLGTGFENIKNEIESCLNSKYDSSFSQDHQYLSHNYFLYILISGGIFSLLAFLFYLFSVFKIVLKANLFILYVFFANIITLLMIEDFLYRAFGLFFFNLIVLIYYKNNQIEKDKNYIEDSYKEL